MLLFAASTSRQLRAVSEGPRRKGKGAKDYYTWLEAKYSKAFYVGESRASGGRQDLEFKASVAVYVSRRPHYANVLEAMLADPQHRNILETPARPRRAFRGKKELYRRSYFIREITRWNQKSDPVPRPPRPRRPRRFAEGSFEAAIPLASSRASSGWEELISGHISRSRT